ncbi:MAG: hypothetical protein IM631_05115 [Cytophagales bacterium]|jgi:hypothetical protein|nr:hypothetical protein [Cytophagales bacterium]MCA6370761.1 hypothetical protein [Cytophagales bacterium]MCA6385923.1 hypothetical protein [Cytophagales bacterium]
MIKIITETDLIISISFAALSLVPCYAIFRYEKINGRNILMALLSPLGGSVLVFSTIVEASSWLLIPLAIIGFYLLILPVHYGTRRTTVSLND